MLQPTTDNAPTSLTARRGRALGCLRIVREHSKARGSARAVLLVIAAHADPDGTGARPSRATIAEQAGVSEQTVKRALPVLVGLGELAIDSKGTGRRASRYRVLVEGLLDGHAQAPSGPVDNVNLPERKGVALFPQGVSDRSPRGYQTDPRPSLDRPLTGGAATAAAVARCARHLDDPAPPPCRGCATARHLADVEAARRRAEVEARHSARVRAELDAIEAISPVDPAVIAAARAAARLSPKPSR